MTRLPATVPAADLPGDGVPIRPAATVLIVDDRPDLQVVMMRRSATSSFVADHTVFPGGRVEDSDSDPAWGPILLGRDEGGMGLIPGSDGDGHGHRVAAARETLEEVGLLIGTGADQLLGFRRVDDDQPDDLDAPAPLRIHLGRRCPGGGPSGCRAGPGTGSGGPAAWSRSVVGLVAGRCGLRRC